MCTVKSILIEFTRRYTDTTSINTLKRLDMRSTVTFLVFSAALHASGQVEVSEDGHLTATPEMYAHSSPATTARGASVPFGAEPDWMNTIRRQVGALEIADLNGDGHNDLAVGCYISNSFPPYDDWHNLVYFNTGTGLETNASWISDEQVHTTDLKIGDINKDGFLDIFSSNGGSSFSDSYIYFGTASGPATSAGWVANEPVATFSLGVALFDVDNDDDLDVITTNQGINPNPFRRTYMFINDNGNLPNTPSWESDDESIQNTVSVGDYDGDTFDDVLLTKWANFETALHRNNAGTLDTSPTWTTGSVTTDRGSAAADFDGDTKTDFVVGRSGTSNPSSKYRNTSADATPILTEDWVSGAPFIGVQDLRAVDVDDDGDIDIGEVHFSDGRAHIYLNQNGTVPTTPSWTYDADNVGTAIAFGDLNGDDITDVAIGYSGEPCVRVFYGIAPPCVADTNGDGMLTPADFTAWIDAFNNNLPTCDQNGDGSCTPTDFTAWIDNFNAGC